MGTINLIHNNQPSPGINPKTMDCMTYMAGLPDKAFQLAIVDPPFNVGASNGSFGNKGKYVRKDLKHYANHDSVPDAKFFTELFRVSTNQIIWGMNYYPQHLYHSGAIIWDKQLTGSPMSDCEIAFQSFSKLVKICRCEWNGFLKNDADGICGDRIHPNQKPIPLYRWCLENYATPGDRILDTHMGSASSAIAAHQMGFDYVGTEIDKDYYDAALKRYNNAIMQQKLF